MLFILKCIVTAEQKSTADNTVDNWVSAYLLSELRSKVSKGLKISEDDKTILKQIFNYELDDHLFFIAKGDLGVEEHGFIVDNLESCINTRDVVKYNEYTQLPIIEELPQLPDIVKCFNTLTVLYHEAENLGEHVDAFKEWYSVRHIDMCNYLSNGSFWVRVLENFVNNHSSGDFDTGFAKHLISGFNSYITRVKVIYNSEGVYDKYTHCVNVD